MSSRFCARRVPRQSRAARSGTAGPDGGSTWLAPRPSRPKATAGCLVDRRRSWQAEPNRRSCAASAMQFEPVIEALGAAGLPYEVVGLGGLPLTPRVQDVVALLSIAHDAARGDRLMRLLTGPFLAGWAATSTASMLRAWSRQQPPTPDGVCRPVGLHRGRRGRPGQPGRGSSTFGRATTGESRGPRVSATPGAGGGYPFAARLAELRSVTAVRVADLVGAAERILALDIEVLARPEFSPAAGRAHLDTFADVARSFAASSDRPTLGGFPPGSMRHSWRERGLDRHHRHRPGSRASC